jgi:hypothetical protein
MLFHNEGNGRFRDVSAASGIQIKNANRSAGGQILGIAPVDLKRDGWIDFIIANDTVPNFVFTNAHTEPSRKSARWPAWRSMSMGKPAAPWASTPRGIATTTRWDRHRQFRQ